MNFEHHVAICVVCVLCGLFGGPVFHDEARFADFDQTFFTLPASNTELIHAY